VVAVVMVVVVVVVRRFAGRCSSPEACKRRMEDGDTMEMKLGVKTGMIDERGQPAARHFLF
jgi:hypothetical protein